MNLITGEKLTTRQQEILDFIISEIRRKGYPPSVREIGLKLGLSSSSTVHSHLKALQRKGYIKRDPTKPRALEVYNFRNDEDEMGSIATRNVPVVGQIAAGSPILAAENIEDTFPLPHEFAGENNFILRVKGDSMIDAGIFNGDYLVVKPQATANNGDITVAMVEDEATVKRFYREKDYIRLQPENSAMAPIIATNVTVLGIAYALLRKL